MSFVSLGGDGSARPTFFEMVAADRLMGSLKAATMYSFSVMKSPPAPPPPLSPAPLSDPAAVAVTALWFGDFLAHAISAC